VSRQDRARNLWAWLAAFAIIAAVWRLAAQRGPAGGVPAPVSPAGVELTVEAPAGWAAEAEEGLFEPYRAIRMMLPRVPGGAYAPVITLRRRVRARSEADGAAWYLAGLPDDAAVESLAARLVAGTPASMALFRYETPRLRRHQGVVEPQAMRMAAIWLDRDGVRYDLTCSAPEDRFAEALKACEQVADRARWQPGERPGPVVQ